MIFAEEMQGPSVTCTINTLQLSNDASSIIIDNTRVTLQIVVSLIDNSRGVIFTHL
jgi:hypothetical protein